ncbi:MAG: MBL fold metallo-hydrolase [Colwellia sp.]|nr:MBL fold metallo-hydrolase [Colwellia sp.]
MNKILVNLFILLLISLNLNVFADQAKQEVKVAASATYLGNEAVMIESGSHKILFDPFFHNDYNTYQLVPEAIRNAIFNGEKPYDAIDIIFISHAHEDHFSAKDMLKFLINHPKAKMVAPKQAADSLRQLSGSEKVMAQVQSVSLTYGDQPWFGEVDGLAIEAVRIPHAGWPGRASVENIVFRVSLDQGITIMHMGDADPDDSHFRPLEAHWQQKITDTAFPPYWFFSSAQGNDILNNRINAKAHIGVHVPVNVPRQLKASGKDYFSTVGDKRVIHQH